MPDLESSIFQPIGLAHVAVIARTSTGLHVCIFFPFIGLWNSGIAKNFFVKGDGGGGRGSQFSWGGG